MKKSKPSVRFVCFTSKKKAKEKYFRIVKWPNQSFWLANADIRPEDIKPNNIGHGEGYTKGSSALHAIVLIKDGKFKVRENTNGKTHAFSLVARNGEVIFQSNRYKDRSLMAEDIGCIMECQNADIFYE